MKRGWNPELESLVRRADPVARIIPEVVATAAADVRERADEWETADTLAGLAVRHDGGVELARTLEVQVASTAGGSALTNLSRGSDTSLVRLEFTGGASGFWCPQVVTAMLTPQRVPGVPRTVARWGFQALWLAGHTRAEVQTEPELFEMMPLHEPVYVPALGGINAGPVTFDLAAAGIDVRQAILPPAYFGSDPVRAAQMEPTAFLHVWGVTEEGTDAGNVGLVLDAAREFQLEDGIRLQAYSRWAAGSLGLDGIAGSPLDGVPAVSVFTQTLAPATVAFTGATNVLDLGAEPEGDVELVGQGETPVGASLTWEVQADDGAWVSFEDGDLAHVDNRPAGGTDLSAASAHPVSARRTYRMRAHLAPAPTVGPMARAMGVRAVTRILLDGEATWTPRGRWAFDPVTLAAEVVEGGLVLPRTGARDYNDAGSEIFSRFGVGELTVRLWLGHPRLARARWLLADEHLVDDLDTHGAAIVATTVSPLVHARAKLPPAIEDTPGYVTREPIEIANRTLADAFEELVASAIAVPERYRGQGIPASVPYTVTNRLTDTEGKTQLDALARLAGGVLIASQGRLKFVDVLGRKDVAAVFPAETIRAVRLTPGLRHRVPEFFVSFQWTDEDGSGGRYQAQVRSFNMAALSKLGTATLDAPREMPDDVARWIDTDELAERSARDTVETLGGGLMLWELESVYAHPELEPGDLVAVQTDAFVAHDPIAARELRGQLWAAGVVQSVGDLMGRRLAVWIRRYSDVVVGAEPVDVPGHRGPLHYALYDPRLVEAGESPTHWALTVSAGDGVEQVHGAVLNFPGEWSAERSEQVRAAARYLFSDPGTIEVPKPGEGTVTIVFLHPVAFDTGGRALDLEGIELTFTGTAAPLELPLQVFESPDGTQAVITITPVDPRKVVAGMEIFLRVPDEEDEEGPFPLLEATGTWSYALERLQDHGIHWRIVVSRSDGGVPRQVAGYTDANRTPGAPAVQRVRIGGQDVVLVDGSDTDTAALFRRSRSPGGELGAEVPIPARDADPRHGVFNVVPGAQEQRFRVYGRNPQGVEGDPTEVLVPPADVVAVPPTLEVSAVPGPAAYTIVWSGSSVLLSIDGAAAILPPASPITAARAPAGTAGTVYNFRGERDGVRITNAVTVPALDADTVTPDLDVDQIAVATPGTHVGFTAAAVNPRTGASLQVMVRLTGCSGTNNGAALPADVTQVVQGPILIALPLASAGTGTVAFETMVPGGGREAQSRTVPTLPRSVAPVLVEPDDSDEAVGVLTLTRPEGSRVVAVEFSKQSGTSAQTAFVPAAGPPWVESVLKVGKHKSRIFYRAKEASGVIVAEDAVSFDEGVIADVDRISAVPDGEGAAQVTCQFDPDTGLGPDMARWRVDGGVWTHIEVPGTRRASFSAGQLIGAPRLLEVQAKNYGGEWGPVAHEGIPAFVPPVALLLVSPDDSDPAMGVLTLTPTAGSRVVTVEIATKAGTDPQTGFAVVPGPPWTGTVAKREKHKSWIRFTGKDAAGVVVTEDAVSFDVGVIADVDQISAVPDGEGTVLITCRFDPDTAIGPGRARWRVDGGTWALIEVAANRRATFPVDQLEGATRLLEVQAQNAAGAWGPVTPEGIPPFVPPAPPPPPPPPPTVVEAAVMLQQGGSCGVSPLIYRVTPEFYGVVTGFHWEVLATEVMPGTPPGAFDPVSGPVAFTQAHYDHVIGGRAATGGGDAYDLYWKVAVVRTSDSAVAGQQTVKRTDVLQDCVA